MTDDDPPEDADEEAIRKRKEELVARAAYDAAAAKRPMSMPCLSPVTPKLTACPPAPQPRVERKDALPQTCLSIASPTPCLSALPYVEPPPPRAPRMTRTVIVALLAGVLIGAIAAIVWVWLTL